MKYFIFTGALHLLHTVDASTKFQLSGLRLSATQHRDLVECPWLDYTAKDFRGAASDLNADPDSSSGSTYYMYDGCYDLDLDSLRQLSTNVGNCFAEQDDFSYDADGFDCYTETSTTRVGCCLGNGMYVVFYYKNEDVQLAISASRCGSSYKYINAKVFPDAATCADIIGDSLNCGSCPNIEVDPNENVDPNANATGSSASARGWSWMILAAMSLLLALLQV